MNFIQKTSLIQKIKKSLLLCFCIVCMIGGSPVCTWAALDLTQIPAYTGEPFIDVNDNMPDFSENSEEAFEIYGELDEWGRCTTAYANIGIELMPTEKRGNISQVKPSGWQSVQYDFVDGNSLYNRCHLIGFQLTAENANEKNLITGTRYLNVEGMLPFENMVADYIKETENHVLYRVTPIFQGAELVARGVQMEAMSVEDEGEGILFNVYCYNVQPGVVIDYATGENWLDTGSDQDSTSGEEVFEEYVLNINTKKFHAPSCFSVKQMNEENKKTYTGNKEELLGMGYVPCNNCNP